MVQRPDQQERSSRCVAAGLRTHTGRGRFKALSRRLDRDQLHLLQRSSQLVGGGLAFWLVTSSAQVLQGMLGISAATPFLAPAAGFVTVGLGSITAAAVADRAPLALSQACGVKCPSSMQPPVLREEDRMVRALRNAVLGIVWFRVLGGRFRVLAPSDVAKPGAFFQWREYLAAPIDKFATAAEKRILDRLGWRFGCHTCGQKVVEGFIGDHQPPRKIADEMNRRLWRKLLGIKINQRFLPQCQSCSTIQSVAVRTGKRKLVYHLWSVRPHHMTGAMASATSWTLGDEVMDDAVRRHIWRPCKRVLRVFHMK